MKPAGQLSLKLPVMLERRFGNCGKAMQCALDILIGSPLVGIQRRLTRLEASTSQQFQLSRRDLHCTLAISRYCGNREAKLFQEWANGIVAPFEFRSLERPEIGMLDAVCNGDDGF